MDVAEEAKDVESLSVEDILKGGVGAFVGRCRMYFKNSTPSGWGVTITEVGCKFFYQDQNGHIVGDESKFAPVTLGSGDSHELVSNNANGCVAQVYVVVKAKWVDENGRRQEKIFQDRHGTDAAHCLLYCPFELAPTYAVTRSMTDEAPMQIRFLGV